MAAALAVTMMPALGPATQAHADASQPAPVAAAAATTGNWKAWIGDAVKHAAEYGTAAYWAETGESLGQHLTKKLAEDSLTTGTYHLTENETLDLTSSTTSALRISGNVVIILQKNSRLNCTATGSGTGGAGIYLPQGSSLTFKGSGSVVAKGASGTQGQAGSTGGSREAPTGSVSLFTAVSWGGAGGKGGSAPGSGIGGTGGVGGAGGAAGQTYQFKDTGNVAGSPGSNGSSGSTGSGMGKLYIKGNVSVLSTAGDYYGGYGQGGGAGTATDHKNGGTTISVGSGGGGGGGGYAGPSAGIGSGGNGGGGGGGGGSGSVRRDGEGYYYGNGGGGGGAGGGYRNIGGDGGKRGARGKDQVPYPWKTEDGGDSSSYSGASGGSGAQEFTTDGGEKKRTTGKGGDGGSSPYSYPSADSVYATTLTSKSSKLVESNVGSGTEAATYKTYPQSECVVEVTSPDVLKVPASEGGTKEAFRWTGQPVTPQVKVTHVPTGTVLTEGNDYKVSYTNNTKAGTAKMTISGTGLSTSHSTLSSDPMTGAGSIEIPFDIRYDMDQLSVKWVDNLAGTSNPAVFPWESGTVGNAKLMLGTYEVPAAHYNAVFTNNDRPAEWDDPASPPTVEMKAMADHKYLWVDSAATTSATFSVRQIPLITTPNQVPYRDAEMGQYYEMKFEADGYNTAEDPITWEYVEKPGEGLPPGLSLSADGILSGTPTSRGTYTATIRAKNKEGSNELAFTWEILELPVFAYHDKNRNGVFDEGEPPLAGVTVKVYPAGDSVAKLTGVTDVNGRCAFNGLIGAGTQAVDVEFSYPDEKEYRPTRVDGIAGDEAWVRNWSLTSGSSLLVEKGLEKSVTITLDAGEKGRFAAEGGSTFSPTKELRQTGYPGDKFPIPDASALNLIVEDSLALVGWYTDADFKNQYGGSVPQQDTILYAKYNENAWTVIYETGEGADPVDPMLLNYDKNTDVRPTAPEGTTGPFPYRPGYLLDYWRYTDPTGTTTQIKPDGNPVAYKDLVSDRNTKTITLIAVWKERSDIAVTLDANGSEGAPARFRGKGDASTELHENLTYNDVINYSAPLRDGYSFIGWYGERTWDSSAATAPSMSIKAPGKDDTLYAIWDADNIGVTFDAVGGAFASGEDGQRAGNPGETYRVPTDPAREGYTFKGWFRTPTGSEMALAPGTANALVPLGDVRYFAQWEPNQVKLTLRAEGAAPDSQTIEGATGEVVEYEFPTRAGHAFAGWNVDGTGTGSMFFSFPPADATYDAVWALGTNTVAFNPGDGSFAQGESGIRTGNPGDAYTPPADPTRPGYVFKGWFTTPEHTSPAPADNLMPAVNATYYAKWSPADVEVVLEPGEGAFSGDASAGTAKRMTGTFGTVIEYPVPAKAGATFVGWRLAQDAAPETASMFPRYPAAEGAQLWATYVDGQVSVLYNPLGGEFAAGESGLRTGTAGEKYAVPDDPKRAGYTFDAWYTQPNGAGDKVALDTLPVDPNTTYYANWLPNSVKVNLYAGDDAYPATQALPGKYAEPMHYTAPAKKGFTFMGWKEAGALDSTAVFTLAYPATDRDLYAVWKANDIEVAYDATGGAVYGDELFSGIAGASYKVPLATRMGHAFLGWYDRPAGGTQVHAPNGGEATFPSQSVTYFAQWRAIEVGAVLDAGKDASPEKQEVRGSFGSVIKYELPTRSNHAFLGWKMVGANDATANLFPTFEALDNQVLQAVWLAGGAVVAFNADGGTFADGETGIRQGTSTEAFTPPASPVREGYTFDGWRTLPAGAGEAFTSTTFPEQPNTVVYASWKPNTIVVTLNLNDPAVAEPDKLQGAPGDPVRYAMPAREGHAFLGWSATRTDPLADEAEKPADTNYFPTFGAADQDLFAVWLADAVTVRFDAGQGSFAAAETGLRPGHAGGSYTLPEAPTKPGWAFAGWHTDSTKDSPVTPDGAFPDKDTTYYAHYAPESVAVELDLNYDGAPAPASASGIFGEKIDYDAPARAGYSFGGWASTRTATTGDRHPTFPETGPATLYAVWRAVDVTAAYDPAGGAIVAGGQAAHTGHVGDSYPVPTAAREGYDFMGWFTTPTGAQPAPSEGDGTAVLPAHDVVYYAQWQAAEIECTFRLGGGILDGSGASIVRTGRYHEAVDWPKLPERTGYVFVGWKAESAADDTATPYLTWPAKSTTYVAVWTDAQNAVVTYHPMGGALKDGSPAVYSARPGSAYSAPEVALRAGYTFDGWAAQPDDANIDHAAGESRSLPATGGERISYYAKWTPITYTMYLDFGDGTLPVEAQGHIGEAVPYEVPERAGYVFRGWLTDKLADKTPELFPKFTAETMGATLHASWSASGLSVSFFTMGGTSGDEASFGNVGDEFAVPSDPVRPGWTFAGWYTGKDGAGTPLGKAAGEKMPFVPGMPQAYYAHWERDTVTVRLNPNGGTLLGSAAVAEVQGHYGEPVPAPSLQRAGWTFIGWKAPSGEVLSTLLFPEKTDPAPEYAAQWSADDVEVIYDPLGGLFAPKPDGTPENGVRLGSAESAEGFSVPAAPTLFGHTFGGWFLDSACTELAPTLSAYPTENKRFFAKWTPNKVSVELSAPGSSSELQSLVGDYGAVVDYLVPQAPGKTFMGWKPAGGAADEARLHLAYPVEDAVYEAVFVEGEVQVGFDPTGGAFRAPEGTGAPADSGLRAGHAGDELTVPDPALVMRVGFRCTGWFTSVEGGERVGDATGAFKLPRASTTYYAQWEPLEASVTLDANGGTIADAGGADQASVVATGSFGSPVEFSLPVRAGHTFAGWSGEQATVDGSLPEDTTMFPVFSADNDGRTLYAQWEAGTARIAFFGNGGSPDASFARQVGESYEPPAEPTREGYVFDGWYDAPVGGNKQVLPAQVTVSDAGNLTYFAQWTKKTGIEAVLDAGTGADPLEQTVTGAYGDLVAASAGYQEPAKPGHTFKGWKLRTSPAKPDAAASKAITFPAEKATFDAVWVQNSIEVTFDANDGAASEQVLAGPVGEGYDLPAAPARTGYTFDGWWTLPAGGSRVFGPDEARGVYPAANTRYFAQWAPVETTVTLQGNGGVFDGDTSKTSIERTGDFGTTIEYALPTRADRVFAGWLAEGSSTPELFPTYPAQAATFEAHWMSAEASALFNPRKGTFQNQADGSPEPGLRVGSVGDSYEAPLPVREGYTFDAWYTQPDGEGEALAEAPSFAQAGTVIFYANWIPNAVEATMHANGGSFPNGAPDAVIPNGRTGETIRYDQPPERPGFGFVGWSGNSSARPGDAGVTMTPAFGVSATEDWYAVWKPGAATVTFNADGGEPSTPGAPLRFFGTPEESYLVPSVMRAGYVFGGWRTEPNGGGDALHGSPGTAVLFPPENTTYYAHWRPIDQRIALHANGGSFKLTGGDVLKVSGTHDALIPTLAGYGEPARSGWDFVGWATTPNDAQGDATRYPRVAANDTGASDLHAQWRAHKVRVTFDAAGGQGGASYANLDADALDAYVLPEAPTREGYTFLGWFSQMFGGYGHDQAPPVGATGFTAPLEDAVWYAHWAPRSDIAVTLDAGSGAFADGSSTKEVLGTFGDPIAYEVPERPGWRFTGWGGGSAGVSYSIDFPARDGVAFTAQWSALAPVTVTYELQGGENTAGSTELRGQPATTYKADSVAQAARTGYAFAGWYSKPNGGGEKHPEANAEGLFAYPMANTVWYAYWENVPIRLELDPAGGAMGGSEEVRSVAGEIGTPIGYDVPGRPEYTFQGWKVEGAADATANLFPTFEPELEGKKLIAVWKKGAPRDASATFFGNGAESYRFDGEIGELYTVPAPPQRLGYIFLGWYYDKNLTQPARGVSAGQQLAYKPAEPNVQYWARWVQKSVSVVLDAQGGAFEEEGVPAKEQQTYVGHYGESIAYTPPVFPGYEFAGWSTDKAAASGSFSLEFPLADETYHALWRPLPFTVVYEGMGGSVDGQPVLSRTGHVGEPCAAPVAIEREGWTFTGWSNKPFADSPADIVEPGAVFAASDETFFAQWSENEVKVTLDLNGGSVDGSEAAIELRGYAGRVVPAPTPVRDKHVFAGWRAEGSDTQELFIECPPRDGVYQAQWRRADVKTATFHPLSGTLAGEAVYTDEGADSFSAPGVEPPAGMVFKGWASDPAAERAQWAAGSVIAFGPETTAAFYALYEPKANIEVKLDPAGGLIGGTDEPVVMSNLTYGQPLLYQAPVREGYVFVGWADAPNTERGNMEVTVPPDNGTLFAQWVENGEGDLRYVAYDPRGGEVDGDLMRHGKVGETYVAPGVKDRAGYVFEGWATSPLVEVSDHGAGETRTFGDEVETTYYARWALRSDIKVTFKLEGGTVAGSPDDIIFANQTYTHALSCDVPVREGYLFMGWSEDPDAALGTMDVKVPAADVALHALWMKKEVPARSAAAFYDAFGGVMLDDPAFVGLVDETYTAPGAEREGYVLKGWSRAVDGAIDHQPGDSLAFDAAVLTVYYAVWEVRSDVTITLDPAGGELSGSPVLEEQTFGSVIVPDVPVRAGHVFQGWRPADDPAAAPSFSIEVGARDAAYEAVWFEMPESENVSVVVYDGMGGYSSQTVFTGEAGDGYTAPTAVREDYDFLGWSSAPGGGLDHGAGVERTFPDATVTIYYAQWERQPAVDLVLTFETGDGEQTQVISGQTVGSLLVPPPPVREGYVFLGWVPKPLVRAFAIDLFSASPAPRGPAMRAASEDPSPSMAIVVPTSNMAYEAVWSKVVKPEEMRAALFDPAGGSLVEGASTLVVGAEGETFVIPELRKRAGFTFEGWRDEAGALHAAGEELSFGGSLQQVFTAVWTADSVEVSLYAPDAAPHTQVLSGAVGEPIGYTAPVRDGWTFVGWKLPSDPDATARRDLLFPEASIAYEAVWKPSVTVEALYYPQGGTVPGEPTAQGDAAGGDAAAEGVAGEVPSGLEAPLRQAGDPGMPYVAPTVAREGYRLVGWSLAPNGAIDHAAGEVRALPDRPTTPYFAVWEPVPIAVSLDPNGGEIGGGAEALPMSGEIGTPISYDIPVRAGHTFVGWGTAPASGSFDMFPVYAPALDGAVLYAQWKAHASSATFFTGGVADATFSGKVGELFTVPADPQRPGHVFGGWFLDRGCTISASIRAGQSVAFTEAANVAYFARWEAVEVTVVLDPNEDEASAAAPLASLAGASVPDARGRFGEPVPYEPPTRPGFTFSGWSTERDAVQGAMAIVFPEVDTTYYAVWRPNEITVEFDPVGGVLEGQTVFTGHPGDAYDEPEEPTCEGFAFQGWSTRPAVQAEAPDGRVPTQNRVYFALWKSNEVKIGSVVSGAKEVQSTSDARDAMGARGSGAARGGYGVTGWQGGYADGGGDALVDSAGEGAASGGFGSFSVAFSITGGKIGLRESGEDRMFLFVPDEGYEIASIVVDGNPIEIEGEGYRLAELEGEHDIDADFRLASFGPLAAFELAARENWMLWLLPIGGVGILCLAVGGAVVVAVRSRKRP